MLRIPRFGAIKQVGKPQYAVPLALVLGFVVLSAALPLPAHAQIVSGAIDNGADFFATIFLWFATIIGHIATTFIGILVQIVQYNDFINAPAVVKGWVVVRDVANMFFIVILLLIAFGSVFRLEEYQYKHHLSKLLLMAVLINFSKSIAGFMIDFAQVIMLTFVNGFKDAAAGNFITGFQLDKMFAFAQSASSGAPAGITGIDFLAAAVLALVTISIATVVVGVYIVVFTLRIVMLWLLIIISPLAYLLAGFPGDAKKYSSQWWDYFGKYVSSGPILAFFLWLSLAVMQLSGGGALGSALSNINGVTDIPAAAVTGIGQSATLLSFIISIMLLLGGLWLTQQLGVMGGGLAKGAFDGLIKFGGKAPLAVTRFAARPAISVGKRAGFDAATSALGGLARVPLIGNTAIRLRSKLVNARKEGEHHDVKGMENLTDESAARIVQRRMRSEKLLGPAGRLLLGERGRNQAEFALQWMMKKGQDHLSPKARKTMEQAAVLQSQAFALEPERAQALNATKQKVTTPEGEVEMNMEELEEGIKADRTTIEANTPPPPELAELTAAVAELTTKITTLDDSTGGPLLNNPRRQALVAEKTEKEKELKEIENRLEAPKAHLTALETALAKVDPSAKAKVNDIRVEVKTLRDKSDALNLKGNEQNQGWWDHALKELDHSAGRVVTVQNNDVFLYDDLGQLLEKFRFTNPHLLDQKEKRFVTDPSTPALKDKPGVLFDKTEFDYRTRRLGAELLRQLPLSATADTGMVMKLLANNMGKLSQVLENRKIGVQKNGEMTDLQGRPLVDQNNKPIDDRHLFAILKAPFYGLNSVRLNESPRKVSFIDKALHDLIALMQRSVTDFDNLTIEEKELMKGIPEQVRRAAKNEMFTAAAFQDRLS